MRVNVYQLMLGYVLIGIMVLAFFTMLWHVWFFIEELT
jgi:lipid-A-disaccharide synthase-like uncharacterized protein